MHNLLIEDIEGRKEGRKKGRNKGKEEGGHFFLYFLLSVSFFCSFFSFSDRHTLSPSLSLTTRPPSPPSLSLIVTFSVLYQGTFLSMWDFLSLLLEDSKTWTVEYPRGGHGTAPSILLQHQGESGKFVGRGGANKLREGRALLLAGNFLQRGRGLGASGALSYLRYLSTYISISLIPSLSVSLPFFLHLSLSPHLSVCLSLSYFSLSSLLPQNLLQIRYTTRL